MNHPHPRIRVFFLTALLLLLIGSSKNLIYASLYDDPTTTSDDLFSLQPCPARCVGIDSSSNNKKKKNKKKTPQGGSRIFYLILVHNERTEADAVHLFRAIRDPRNIIVIHYDRKVASSLLENKESSVLLQEVKSCPCGSTVRVESVHSVEWSKWSMNLPTLWGLELAASSTEFRDQWDVFINLSGDTMPVYTTDTMADV